jgi:hypothetical protein
MHFMRFDCRRGLGIFLFTTASRMALGPTQPPIQWVPGFLSLRVKRPGREADHSPPSSTEVKNAWNYTSTPQYAFMGWCLVKHRDNFTFPYLYAKNNRVNLNLASRTSESFSRVQSSLSPIHLRIKDCGISQKERSKKSIQPHNNVALTHGRKRPWLIYHDLTAAKLTMTVRKRERSLPQQQEPLFDPTWARSPD